MTPGRTVRPIAVVALTPGGRGPRTEAWPPLGLNKRFTEGPLTVAWNDVPAHSFHVSEQVVCLVEGSVYAVDGQPLSANSAGSAAGTLAEAYTRAGNPAFEQVRGEYWALVWRRDRHGGVIVTDQLGTRSPYFSTVGPAVTVASEVCDLLAVLPVSPDPDPVAVAHWLMATAAPGEMTLFAGIRRLPAAHLLALGDTPTATRRYWTPAYKSPLGEPREELARRVHQMLEQSIARRLSDDQPAAVRLSGGLDSSVVTALAVGQRQTLGAYSATFPEHPSIDESELIDLTVAHLGVRSTRFAVRSGSVLSGALDYLDAWRVPPSSPNLFFWRPLLDRAAADGVVVMLDGEGGDEVFGFSPYLLADLLRRARVRRALELTRHWPTGLPATRGRISYRFTQFGVKGAMPAAAHLLMRALRRPERYLPAWMRSGLGSAWLEGERSAYEWKQLNGPRWWSFLVHAVTRGAGPALVYEQSRRLAAWAGLDARHPLVDVDVIELMLGVPPSLAFESHLNRPLLRDSVAGLLPDEVRLRPRKSSFDALFHQVLSGPELPIARQLLDPAEAELGNYIDMDVAYRQLLADDPPRDHPALQRWALQVWRLLTAECWLRSQRDSTFTARLRDSGTLANPHIETIESRRLAARTRNDSATRP